VIAGIEKNQCGTDSKSEQDLKIKKVWYGDKRKTTLEKGSR
jgi:hypothetical protein